MADEKEEVGGIGGLDDDGGSLKLTAQDGQEYELDRKAAFISKLVKTSVETDSTASEVPIPSAKSNILEKIVEYMRHHNGDEPPIIEKPLRSKIMKDVCKDKWDADFIDKIGENRQELYDLILAANYMDIKSLLHLGCAKVASLIKGQPLEKIKDILAVNQKEDKKESAKE